MVKGNFPDGGNMYPELMVIPMREELVRAGIEKHAPLRMWM